MKRLPVLSAIFVVLFAASAAFALETTVIYKQTREYLVAVIVEGKPAISYSEYKSIKKEWEEFVKKPDKSKNDIAKMKKQLKKINPDFNSPLDFGEIEKVIPKFEELWPYPGAKAAVGAGFFVNQTGMVVTNHHVVNIPNSTARVLFKGKYYSAKVIGKDPFSDLALVQVENIDPAKYTSVVLGDSDVMIVGQRVVIAGNPQRLLGSLSEGIVSGLNRSLAVLGSGAASWPGLIQTDASIDHGNSGGPMIDKNSGHVIGVVNSTIQSFGFAIPVNALKRFMYNVAQFGKSRWGMLGADITDVPVSENAKEIVREEYGLPEVSVDFGALVRKVRENTPAQKAGLKAGDVIIKVGSQTISDSSAMSEPNSKSKITVIRGGKELELTVVWAERPDNF